MKTLRMLILSVFLAAAAITTNQVKAQVSVGADITFNVFHNGLSAYGRWVTHPSYGQVWVSNERDFIPYRTNGHWAYTDDGWTWVSDYSWGWAPFHYGRWDYDAAYGGYYWVPGYEWGPAWVSWRRDNNNYGWAPLRPGINVGIGVSFGADIPAERWTFVPNRYIAHRDVNRYYVDRSRNVTIIRSTTIINNAHDNRDHITVVGGPQRVEVEKVTHARINTYAVATSSRPGGARVEKNTINIYRPVVNKTTVVNKEVVNNNKTVINNNQKTVINKNSNNTTVKTNKVNNKTVVNANKNVTNNNNKKVTNNSTVNNDKKTTAVHNNNTVNNNNKKVVNNNNKTVTKKSEPVKNSNMAKKPAQKPKQSPKQNPKQKPDNN